MIGCVILIYLFKVRKSFGWINAVFYQFYHREQTKYIKYEERE